MEMDETLRKWINCGERKWLEVDRNAGNGRKTMNNGNGNVVEMWWKCYGNGWKYFTLFLMENRISKSINHQKIS